ncbi:PREDICTED: vezatin isoform X2 [Gavialis gangeticus]|uniref:vezatin isoform X2 n=1 Tax=Gavialis gangeticus TaxID=94835 RepID=UPI00092EBED0|nr:PREDICTED: vezatin isoform X2 [Gavialis gangeticus]
MTPDFDEEVVFENSPLYQYLQDLGHTDFEVCSAVSQKTEQCTAEEGQQGQTAQTTQKQGTLSKLPELFRSWFPFSPCKKKDDILYQLDVGFRLDALRTILQQEVLLQEDVELIELLDPSILSGGQSKQQENGHLPTLRSLATPNIWDVSLLLAFVSAFIVLPSWWSWSFWPVWGLILSVYVVVRVWGTWRTAKLQMSLRKYSLQLEDTVAHSRAFTNLVRKALRLIQETEVISRGFTLVSAACPFNKAGQHPSQHLIGLRKAVYRSVRANFRASRLATLYMLKNYPLNSETDNVTNYICVVPFKELGLGLSEEQVSEEEAHNLTDGFSLPALKVLFQLWVGQSSEFFRRLVLLLSSTNASPKPLITPERLPHHILSDVTQGLPHTHAACLEELKRSYEFYRYFETQHQSGLERSTKRKQKSRELNSLHIAVRSLQLHLKALLNEVIILEDELEKLVSSKETQELPTEAYQVLEQKLKLIQPHVQASNSCWEEAISQVEKMGRRNPDIKGKPEVTFDNTHCTMLPLLESTLHIEDKDPVPEEQELEAYVEDTDMDSEYRTDDFYCFSQEERERQRHEREESKRVLQELKSVLGFKASEAERQKWKQLLFSDHAAVKPLSPVEPVEPINNLESPMNSDIGKQDGIQGSDDSEERDSNAKPHATEKRRTEYLFEDPVTVENKDIAPGEGASPVAEKRTCYQGEGEGEESILPIVDGLETSQTPLRDALQSSIRHRLAQLHISTDFNFTSGLAAQVAARSLTFTTMQEQTFGDEEKAEEELQDSENHMQENNDEGTVSENGEALKVPDELG